MVEVHVCTVKCYTHPCNGRGTCMYSVVVMVCKQHGDVVIDNVNTQEPLCLRYMDIQQVKVNVT